MSQSKMVLTYDVNVENGINIDKKELEKFINNTYKDKRGIRKLYKNKLDFKRVKEGEKPKFGINLVDEETVKGICGFENLSCADRSDNNIYLNYQNWIYGSPTLKEGYGRDWRLNSRRYVVNHETMHLLGFDHPPPNVRYKPDQKISVMVQQTIENRGGKLNPWPQESDKKFFRDYIHLKLR